MESNQILKSGSTYFYGGYIDCIQGDVSVEAVDKVLDLIEEYEELVESVNQKKIKKRY